MTSPHHTALTIAGTDPTSAAGIAADLAVFRDLGCHGLFAITCVVAQNTRGVQHIHPIPPETFTQQLQSVLQDIPPATVKIGLLSSSNLIPPLLQALQTIPQTPVVLDPVLASGTDHTPLLTTPHDLLDILPLTTLLTPNTDELQTLTRSSIQTPQDAIRAAHSLQTTHPNLSILIKGGHLPSLQGDLFIPPNHQPPTHLPWTTQHPFDVRGTGCHLSSAIAANLAQGYPLLDSIQRARSYMDRLWNHAHAPLGSGKRLFLHTRP